MYVSSPSLRLLSDCSFLDAPLLYVFGTQNDDHYTAVYGGKDVKPSLEHLARKPKTWAEYARTVDWDTTLG